MSQLAAPTRAPRRASAARPKPNTRTGSRTISRPGTKVAAAPRSRDSRFMILGAMTAIAAAIAMLLLNTMRAEQSFTLSTLQSDVSTLNDREQALDSEISAVSAPEQLALRADGYGMVRASQVTYVSRATGKKLGVAGSAQGGSPLSVNTLPDTPSSRAAGELLATGTVGLHLTDPIAQAAAANKAAAAKAAAAKTAAGKTGAPKGASTSRGGAAHSGAAAKKPTK